jgi:hypothetical protein
MPIRAGEMPKVPAGRQWVVCPKCERRIEATQKRCWACGTDLKSDETPADDPSHSKPAAVEDSTRDPSDSPDLQDAAPSHPGETLLTLGASAEAKSGVWKFVVAGLAILLVGFVYLQWVSARRAPANPSQPANAAPTASGPSASAPTSGNAPPTKTAPAETSASVPPAPSQPAPEKNASEKNASEKNAPEQNNANAVAGPASGASSAPPTVIGSTSAESKPVASAGSSTPAPPVPFADDGTQELRQAQRYLSGKSVPKDPAEAVKWLWKSVAKGNPGASMALADLYIRGDGVPQSCDQARLLLNAAAKKSVEAAQKLGAIESSGCP